MAAMDFVQYFDIAYMHNRTLFTCTIVHLVPLLN